MTNILIFGHKNPDTDTICSALAYANLKNILGDEAKAVRLGELNEETKFVLNYFGVKAPELIKTVAGNEIVPPIGTLLNAPHWGVTLVILWFFVAHE